MAKNLPPAVSTRRSACTWRRPRRKRNPETVIGQEEFPTGCAHGLRARIRTDQNKRKLPKDDSRGDVLVLQLSVFLIRPYPCPQAVCAARGELSSHQSPPEGSGVSSAGSCARACDPSSELDRIAASSATDPPRDRKARASALSSGE